MIVAQKDALIAHAVFQEIVNRHTVAFDSKNLYEKPLNSCAIRKWQKAIVGVGDFLESTAKKQKKLLVDYFVEMHKINRNLINAIKKAYTAKSNQIFDIHIHQEFSDKFAKIEKRARYIQKTLYWVDDTHVDDKKAIKCTQDLAQFIAATARKARLNLNVY
jgi:hypothetical protein